MQKTPAQSHLAPGTQGRQSGCFQDHQQHYTIPMIRDIWVPDRPVFVAIISAPNSSGTNVLLLKKKKKKSRKILSRNTTSSLLLFFYKQTNQPPKYCAMTGLSSTLNAKEISDCHPTGTELGRVGKPPSTYTQVLLQTASPITCTSAGQY